MKRIIKLIFINLAVFIVLWTGVEVVLHLLGVDTVHEINKKTRNPRFQSICRRALTEKLVVYNAFYTDSDGIFKANPAFDFNLIFKENGRYIINSDGFRGNEFKPVETPRPSLFLVGDSFVWGNSAAPIQNSFADLLQNEGYYVYNGGIGGTDPLQYLKVIKKYTPVLKPKVTAVCIYMGNDTRPFPHPTQPNKNLYYISNFGYFLGYDNRDGHYFNSAEESFAFFKKRYCGCSENIGDYFMNDTVLGKLVSGLMIKARRRKPDPERKWLRNALLEMQQVCEKSGSEFMVLLIPKVKGNMDPTISIKKRLHFFKDLPYFYPSNLKITDYCSPPDDHFNNPGHRKFADFIIRILKEKGYFPVKTSG